jgi:transposase
LGVYAPSGLKFGKLIAPKNNRNSKNPEILLKNKLTDKDKQLLKHRIKIENFFAQLKTFKRINLRYDKYSKIYFNYIILAALSFY